jgi:hypothetical protein
MEEDNLDARQNMTGLNCPFCSKQIQSPPSEFVGVIYCNDCSSMFHFPHLKHEEKQLVALMEIKNSIKGISSAIIFVFLLLPLFLLVMFSNA